MMLNPTQVKEKFGPMFSQRFLTMVDASKNVAEIIETCAVRGTIEWDAVNRCRAGGLIEWCEVEGTTMCMRARPGYSSIKFGPTDVEYGGQGLEAVERNAAGIEFIELFNEREGRIGALAAIALSEERPEAAALYNDAALRLIRK